MKTSDLIKELADFMSKNGDCEVLVETSYNTWHWANNSTTLRFIDENVVYFLIQPDDDKYRSE